MEADRGEIIMLLGLGMFLGVLLSFAMSCLIAQSGERVGIQEQVGIQEEEMESIGTYKVGAITIFKMHDNKDNVTCWMNGYKYANYNGMSCIPDHMLAP